MTTQPHERRWYQYSLKGLFLFVTATAVAVYFVHSLQELGILIVFLSIGVSSICFGFWKKRRAYVVTGFLFILVLSPAFFSLTTIEAWVGHKKVLVTIHVQNLSGQAVPGAFVEMTNYERTWRYTVTTDSTGVAQVFGEFQTCGSESILRHTGLIEILSEELNVNAAGYENFNRELGEIVPRPWDLYATTPREAVVKLRPEKPKDSE